MTPGQGELLRQRPRRRAAQAPRRSGLCLRQALRRTLRGDLSVDQVIFREPIHVGELVTFLASVNYTGRTSMEVGVKVMTENIHERTVRHTNSCFFTMVAMDDQRRPVAGASAGTGDRDRETPLRPGPGPARAAADGTALPGDPRTGGSRDAGLNAARPAGRVLSPSPTRLSNASSSTLALPGGPPAPPPGRREERRRSATA